MEVIGTHCWFDPNLMTFIMWTKTVEMVIIFFCISQKVLEFWSVLIVWVNDDIIFICGWTIHLIISIQNMSFSVKLLDWKLSENN